MLFYESPKPSFLSILAYSPPTHTGAGHCEYQHWLQTYQWLSLVKPSLKVTLVGRNRSLVARTNKRGWAASFSPTQEGHGH